MNKLLRIVLVVLVLVGILGVVCTTARAESESDRVVCLSDSNVEKKNSFKEIGPMTCEEAIKTYRKAAFDHVWKYWTYGYFLDKDEYDYLVENGFEVNSNNLKQFYKYDSKEAVLREYYMPIIFEGENGTELWYTSRAGILLAVSIDGKLNNGYNIDVIGDTHHTLEDNEVSLKKCFDYDIVYDSDKGLVSVWEIGVKIREHFVPENSIYAGFSKKEGFIFRNGSDVYAVRDYGCGTDEYDVRVIAHDVEFVIIADYKADNLEKFSQPLFLMKDGTVKCYCTLYSDVRTPADDPSNLIDIRFEGGFNLE